MELQSKRAFAPVAAVMAIGRKVESFMVDVDKVDTWCSIGLEWNGSVMEIKIAGNIGLFIPGSLRTNGLTT